MHISHLGILVCPKDKTPLTVEPSSEMDGDFVRSGMLLSAAGRKYPVKAFVPRFTENDGYAESFSVEWERHPDILHNFKTNFTAYRQRFTTETKWDADLTGQYILEAGCGPGAITPFALETGATVVSFDLSNSVEQARKTIGAHERSLILQASIFEMPFKRETFDKVFCFGVLQHTPDPAAAMGALAEVLLSGGALAADSYMVPDPKLGGGHRLVRAKYRFRKVLPRLPPRALHHVVSAYVSFLFPLYRRLRENPKGIEFMRSLMMDDYRQRMTGMDEEFYREFAILDIFDFLSPKYDIPQTVESFRKIFVDIGMLEIDVHPGWNGIEGRAVKSFVAPNGSR
jgi:SAM-dependent methyltransferase